jgi:polyhydroxyalkanoate synthesis regulator protein
MCDDEAGRGVLSFPTSLLAQLICFLGKLVDDI